MAFASEIRARSADDYADFLIPHLNDQTAILDAGCGKGTISIGLAERCASVTGVDVADNFADAIQYANENGYHNIRFQAGDLYRLAFPDDEFDACLCHSVLEALERPEEALHEIARVCKAGAVVGVASVEYAGIILAGEDVTPLKRFYEVRERLWLAQGVADPYLGRNLRRLLNQAGFKDVLATTKYFCYGTTQAVREFGIGRAADCDEAWYAGSALASGLVTGAELAAMKRAWEDWSSSPSSYFAFPWCRAVGWKP